MPFDNYVEMYKNVTRTFSADRNDLTWSAVNSASMAGLFCGHDDVELDSGAESTRSASIGACHLIKIMQKNLLEIRIDCFNDNEHA